MNVNVIEIDDWQLMVGSLSGGGRGKPSWTDNFDDRNPNQFLFPALNFHTDELSCAIGVASLAHLQNTISRRLALVSELSRRLKEDSKICAAFDYTPNDSPFVHPILVNRDCISCSKPEFARAVLAQGIGLNPHYQYVVADWPYLKPCLAADFDTPNARDIRDRSFMLYLNENYGGEEVNDCVKAIAKVEKHYAR